MASTTPNKEIVRRVCLLHDATECYLFVETGDEYVEILADIPNEKLSSCLSELESWAGMRFKLYNYQRDKEFTSLFKEKSIQILPIYL